MFERFVAGWFRKNHGGLIKASWYMDELERLKGQIRQIQNEQVWEDELERFMIGRIRKVYDRTDQKGSWYRKNVKVG